MIKPEEFNELVQITEVPQGTSGTDAERIRLTENQYTTSEALFAGARELVIKHAGDEYRLRLTNQGKLILTK